MTIEEQILEEVSRGRQGLNHGISIGMPKLESIMDKENDSIRFYFIGKNWQRKVEMVGRQTSFDPEGTLIV